VRARELGRVLGDKLLEADSPNNLGVDYSDLGGQRQAVALCEEALVRSREPGNRVLEAATLDSLGKCHHRAGDHAEAISYFQRPWTCTATSRTSTARP
jgi:tetratricopeptide (TPR) repeat protein